MRFGLLLGPDRLDPVPVARKFGISGLVHMDFGCAAQASERDHNAADLLLGIAFGPTEHVIDKGDSVIPATAVGLGQFQGFFKKAMGTLRPVGPDLRWEA